MKSFLVLFLAVMSCLSLSAQSQELAAPSYSLATVAELSPVVKLTLTEQPKIKIPGASRVRVGKILTVAGIVLTGVGIALIADSHPDRDYDDDSGEAEIESGIAALIYGQGMIVTGIVLWTTGNKRVHNYYKRQQNVSFNFQGPAAKLSYRF